MWAVNFRERTTTAGHPYTARKARFQHTHLIQLPASPTVDLTFSWVIATARYPVAPVPQRATALSSQPPEMQVPVIKDWCIQMFEQIEQRWIH